MAGIGEVKASIKDLKWYEWIMAAVMIGIAGLAVYNGFTDPNSKNPGWLTIVNFISAICGVFCVFLTAKASVSNFWFATVNTTVYIIYLGTTQIANITRAAFGSGSSDVRLDITITQINGYLDIFVFVNRELFAKQRSEPFECFSPTNLTFSPSDLTKIRLIRFVPGGFILDEPESLLTDLLDE